MREPDGDEAVRPERRPRRADHLLDERVEPVPRDRGLERLAAARPSRRACRARTARAGTPRASCRRRRRGLRVTVPPCSSHSAHARASCSPSGAPADSKPSTSSAALPSPASVSAASRASIRRQLAGRRPSCTIARTAAAPAAKPGERDRRAAPLGRPRQHAHPRLGDHGERALGAEQQPVRRRPGAGGGQPPALPHLARRGDRADGLDEVVDVRRPGREVPAGARRDPAAERRELERLRVEAQRQPVLAELPLQLRPGRARLDPRRARAVVDLEHAVQRAQAQRDGAGVRAGPRVDAADDARAAAGRDHGEVRAGRPLQHRAQLVLVARRRDRVGRVREAAAEPAHDVEVRAPVRVQRARVRVLAERQPGRERDARGGQLDRLERHRLLRLRRAEAEVRGEPGGGRAQLVRGRPLVLVAPAPVAPPPHAPQRNPRDPRAGPATRRAAS